MQNFKLDGSLWRELPGDSFGAEFRAKCEGHNAFLKVAGHSYG